MQFVQPLPSMTLHRPCKCNYWTTSNHHLRFKLTRLGPQSATKRSLPVQSARPGLPAAEQAGQLEPEAGAPSLGKNLCRHPPRRQQTDAARGRGRSGVFPTCVAGTAPDGLPTPSGARRTV